MQIRHPFFTQRSRRGGVPADVSQNNESFDERIVAFYSGCHECSSVSEYFSVFEKKKKKKKIMDIGRAKISYIFSIDTAMTSFEPSFFSTFNPHYLFSFSRCQSLSLRGTAEREKEGEKSSDPFNQILRN